MLSIHCKIALFFSFFALRGVSGCVHLEPRKKIFVALGKEFDMYQFIIVVIPKNGLHAILSLQLLKGD